MAHRRAAPAQADIAIFDPPMCCPTGLCGPALDQTLLDTNELVLTLKERGLIVERYQMQSHPQAFVGNPEVMRLVRECNMEALPITAVRGVVIKSGAYPTRAEVEAALEGGALTEPEVTAVSTDLATRHATALELIAPQDPAGLLEQSAELHKHLCPHQVLGARMGVYAGELLGLELPQTSKRLYTLVETDGCFADGVSVATGCWLGRRTMRLVDYGKVAATFVDTKTWRAVRVWPNPAARGLAGQYAPGAKSRCHAYLAAYQVMPLAELLARAVELTIDLKTLISRPGVRARGSGQARQRHEMCSTVSMSFVYALALGAAAALSIAASPPSSQRT